MKKLILIYLVLLTAAVAMAQRFPPGALVSSKRASSPGGVCNAWKQQTTDNDQFNNTSGGFGQKVKNDSGSTVTVCKLTIKARAISTTQWITCSLNSAADGSGTAYGSASQQTTISTGADALYDLTWSSNPTIPANQDFYLLFSAENGPVEIVFKAGFISGGTLYENDSYTVISSGSAQLGSDLYFVLFTQ